METIEDNIQLTNTQSIIGLGVIFVLVTSFGITMYISGEENESKS